MSLPLNGSTQWVTVPDNAVLRLAATGGWTIAGWAKIVTDNDGSGVRYPFSWGAYAGEPASAHIYFYEHSHATNFDKLRAYVKDGAGESGLVPLSAATPGTSRNWQHIFLRRSGNAVELYVNGVLDGTVTNAAMVEIDSTAMLYLGSQVGASCFKGKLAEWAKWDSALTVGEGSQLASLSAGAGTASPAGAKPGDIGTPVLWLPLYNDAVDDAGSLDGSVAGGATFDAADHPVSYGPAMPVRLSSARRFRL